MHSSAASVGQVSWLLHGNRPFNVLFAGWNRFKCSENCATDDLQPICRSLVRNVQSGGWKPGKIRDVTSRCDTHQNVQSALGDAPSIPSVYSCAAAICPALFQLGLNATPRQPTVALHLSLASSGQASSELHGKSPLEKWFWSPMRPLYWTYEAVLLAGLMQGGGGEGGARNGLGSSSTRSRPSLSGCALPRPQPT